MGKKRSENWAKLPEEIIGEILSRLPVKALMKFRCVSKSWLSLISSPEFIKFHRDFSSSRDRLIYVGHCGFPKTFRTCSMRLPFSVDTVELDMIDRKVIEGSCNGIVCLSSSDYSKRLILWNPSTRKSKELPLSGFARRGFISYGFGYDESTDDYKLVELSTHWNRDEKHVSVYSLRSNSWRNVEPIDGFLHARRSGVFVDGAIYWTVSFPRTKSWGIVTFNLANHTWSILDPPFAALRYHVDWISLGVSRNCLWLSTNDSNHLKIWLLKGSIWSQLPCVPYDRKFGMYCAVFVSEEEGIVLRWDRGLTLFKFSLFCDFLCYDRYTQVTTYTETLISP